MSSKAGKNWKKDQWKLAKLRHREKQDGKYRKEHKRNMWHREV